MFTVAYCSLLYVNTVHVPFSEADSSDYMLKARTEGLETSSSSDDDDDWVQFNIQESEGHVMRARLSVKYKLIHRASANWF